MTKTKDRRYEAVKAWINSGGATTFREIFDIVPRTQVAKDTGMHYDRLSKKIINQTKLTVRDILRIAELLEVDDIKLYSLISAEKQKKQIK